MDNVTKVIVNELKGIRPNEDIRPLKVSQHNTRHIAVNLTFRELYDIIVEQGYTLVAGQDFNECSAYIEMEGVSFAEFELAIRKNVHPLCILEVTKPEGKKFIFTRGLDDVRALLPQSYLKIELPDFPKVHKALVGSVLTFTEVSLDQLTLKIHDVTPTSTKIYITTDSEFKYISDIPQTWSRAKNHLAKLIKNRMHAVKGANTVIYFYRDEDTYFFSHSDDF